MFSFFWLKLLLNQLLYLEPEESYLDFCALTFFFSVKDLLLFAYSIYTLGQTTFFCVLGCRYNMGYKTCLFVCVSVLVLDPTYFQYVN